MTKAVVQALACRGWSTGFSLRRLAVILEKKPTDRRVILRSHMVVGQILIFLAGRETIRRRLNLTGYSDEELKEIKQALDDQLELLRSATEARK